MLNNTQKESEALGLRVLSVGSFSHGFGTLAVVWLLHSR